MSQYYSYVSALREAALCFPFKILDRTLRFNACQELVALDILPMLLQSFPSQSLSVPNPIDFPLFLSLSGEQAEFYFHDKISNNLY